MSILKLIIKDSSHENFEVNFEITKTLYRFERRT